MQFTYWMSNLFVEIVSGVIYTLLLVTIVTIVSVFPKGGVHKLGNPTMTTNSVAAKRK